jgi:large subunit ribosomal protein L21e
MVKHSKGNRNRTRKVFRKDVRERGSIPPLSLLMKEYKEGEKVLIKVNPAIHKGLPHRRYQGRIGIVVGKRGRSYEVEVRLGDKMKKLYVRPEHLRPWGGEVVSKS